MHGMYVFLCEYTSHAYILPYCLCVKNECVQSRFLNIYRKLPFNVYTGQFYHVELFSSIQPCIMTSWTRLETKRANRLNCPFHSKFVSFYSFSCYHYTCIYKFSRCSLAELCIAKWQGHINRARGYFRWSLDANYLRRYDLKKMARCMFYP
jgi:hypothetical protein